MAAHHHGRGTVQPDGRIKCPTGHLGGTITPGSGDEPDSLSLYCHSCRTEYTVPVRSKAALLGALIDAETQATGIRAMLAEAILSLT